MESHREPVAVRHRGYLRVIPKEGNESPKALEVRTYCVVLGIVVSVV
jgi:hypothetical protein